MYAHCNLVRGAGTQGKLDKKGIFIKQARRIWPAGGGPLDANLWN
jgi:hypothetical protein